MRPLGNVLITGGASGLGAATVEAVLAAGGCPLVLDRNAPLAEVDHVQADLADRAATEDAVAALVAAGGGRFRQCSPQPGSTAAARSVRCPLTSGNE